MLTPGQCMKKIMIRDEMEITILFCALDIIESRFGWDLFLCLNTEAKSRMLSALKKALQQSERGK